jgi:uncharacterized integral membrane protein (TIGR00698 family)
MVVMNTVHQTKTGQAQPAPAHGAQPHPRPSPAEGAAPGRAFRVAALLAVGAGLVLWASPPAALAGGILFALAIGHPFAHWNRQATKWLLQASVVFLGFGVDLPAVLRLGANGSVFAALTIGATLLLGRWLGRKFDLDGRTSTLISAGTAICGGSAIAAVSTVIGATETEIAVSIGAIFVLNGIALYLFPLAGHLVHLSQAQFGLWAGVAIHDISSVVGAGMSYGPEALSTATAVKLSRTLWIIPMTLALALPLGRGRPGDGNRCSPKNRTHLRGKIAVPWFVGLFLLASLARSYVPGVAAWAPWAVNAAHHGTILVLFLIGASLSLRALRAAGWRTVTVGLLLWLFVSASSLGAILLLKLGQ